jgi:plasmid replication initiation protein
MKAEQIVVMDNNLVESLDSMTLCEKRLIYILLSQIRPTLVVKRPEEDIYNPEVSPEEYAIKPVIAGDDIAGKLFRLSVRDYSELTGTRLDVAREELIDVASRLYTRSVSSIVGNSFNKFRWVQQISFEEELDEVSLMWSTPILPFISNLTKYFVQLKLVDLLRLRSSYSWRLYELLKVEKGKNVFKKAVNFEVIELQALLNVPDSRKEYKFFKNKVLNIAVKELVSKKVMPDLAFKETKSGRKIVGLEFSW